MQLKKRIEKRLIISKAKRFSVVTEEFRDCIRKFITKASLHNYADDNILPACFADVASLMELLSQKSNTTIDWLISNHMIVNPKKFQTIVIPKRNLQNSSAVLSINNMTLKPKYSIE